jgi:hypothetical protein
MKFSLRLANIYEDEKSGSLIRAVDLRMANHSINCFAKIPQHPLEHFSSISIPINEVYFRLTYEEIDMIDRDNEKKNRFISNYLKPKLRKGKVNVALPVITIYRKPSIAEMEQISQFVADLVYSHPDVTLAVPPKLVLPDEIEISEKYDFFQLYLKFLLTTLDTYKSNLQLCYLIPDYITRASLPKLIDYYVSSFGEEALLILDAGGKRFSASPYADVSLLHREMEKRGIESYAIYLFNHKGRKRSGKEVPSEDLLALLNGVNLVGPNHAVIPLPRDVIKTKKTVGKIFNKEDFLFYPEDKAPNAEEFRSFCAQKRKDRMLDIFNDIGINFSAMLLNNAPTETLSNLKRTEFKNTLSIIAKKRRSLAQQKGMSLASFL